jgi:hypothetical protein
MSALAIGGENKGRDKHDGKEDRLYHFLDLVSGLDTQQFEVLEGDQS